MRRDEFPITDYELTLACLKSLLEDHAKDPFGVLREAGIQAELRERLLSSFPDRAQATVVEGYSANRFAWDVLISTKRVQLEMKILYPENADSQLIADVVVLRADRVVTLTCHANGPGDIVASICPDDVAVAIEIKASPSRTLEQRQKYACDLERLLQLNEHCGINGFFLFLDKSHPRYGSVIGSRWKSNSVDTADWAALRKLLGPVNITERPPAAGNAVATMYYLCPLGLPRHLFVWRPAGL